ncbi:MAG: Rieske (2Fe-2S) protein [Nitrospirota bacterium]|nr:Rieske (2Fe-2S) protein [Nitrospirota bacterium]MDE3118380.1 Rieske (2Fe-2S) protein [Nitrospirota bacterium]MDE3225083.1 Rieske (2Fe-2S) protein [Nitrospirota bacterium]
MSKWVSVAKVSELEPGMCRSVEADGYGVALFNVEGTIYALDNCCPHAGGPLGEGTLKGRHVECPWHGWRFNVCTGERPENPAIAASRYRVDVVGEDIRVWLPPETEGAEP